MSNKNDASNLEPKKKKKRTQKGLWKNFGGTRICEFVERAGGGVKSTEIAAAIVGGKKVR
jgi:hypothetical protein